jgi:BolA protein
MMVDTIEERLRQALQPTHLTVINESDQHAGHSGYTDGESHFRVILTCEAFNGKSRVARHRLVYDALADLMPTPIHALAIIASSPDETTQAPGSLPG